MSGSQAAAHTRIYMVVLTDATHCVLHATMDAALVPSCSGAGPRSDASRVVALDGLLSDAECHALLCWLVGEKIPDGPEHPITVRQHDH